MNKWVNTRVISRARTPAALFPLAVFGAVLSLALGACGSGDAATKPVNEPPAEEASTGDGETPDAEGEQDAATSDARVTGESDGDVVDGQPAATHASDTSGSPVARAYASILDDAAGQQYPYRESWNEEVTGKYRYFLQDMTGDGVPELLLGAQVHDGSHPHPLSWRYVIFAYDPDADAAVRVGDVSTAEDRSDFLLPEDGVGLLLDVDGSEGHRTRYTVRCGTVIYSDATCAPLSADGSPARPDYRGLGDREPLGAMASVDVADANGLPGEHDYECDLFLVDVDEGSGNVVDYVYELQGGWTISLGTPDGLGNGLYALLFTDPDMPEAQSELASVVGTLPDGRELYLYDDTNGSISVTLM